MKPHDVDSAVTSTIRALGNPCHLHSVDIDGEAVGAVGRWRHGDIMYERSTTSCFQLVLNVSGGHVVDQLAGDVVRSARIEEGSVGMLVPDRTSTIYVKGNADVVLMFLDQSFVSDSLRADHEPPDDCFHLSLLDFHAALTRVLVTFGLSGRPAADAFAVAATEAARGIRVHQSVTGRRSFRGGLSPRSRQRVDKAIQHWLESGDGPPPGLRALAKQAGLSPSYFLRSFCAETGATPGKAIEARRVREALRHLLGSSAPVSEIGERLGYSSPSHFIDAFKRAAGVTPGSVRLAAAERRPGQERNGAII